MLSIEGNIVNTSSTKRGRVEIDEVSGLIVGVTEPTGVADRVLKEELIFPGFIDLHVHAREDMSHTQEYKEDFITAGAAAINGGVVAFADMPNNKIPPIDDTSHEAKNNLAKRAPVEIVLYAGVGAQTNPLTLGHSPTGEAKKVPYKVFMGQSIGDLFFTSREALERAIEKYKGQHVSFHCEDPEILEKNITQETHESKRPPEAEISAVDFALELIEKYKIIGKICHASTVEGIEKIIKAKNRGVNVTVEVTPHHLYFDETMLKNNRTEFQVNPPIRQTQENRLALIKFLKDGHIDYLATDHAPHSKEEKQKGISGLTHLDTYGSVATWLMSEHGFTPEDIVRVCAQNPAKFFNEFTTHKYGEIKEGFVGSLTILDPKKSVKITEDFLKTKCGWSPFLGVTFPGSVVATIIKGKIYEK